jgi:hypothetical protein
MIINSQFFITHYNGKAQLPLKTKPQNLSTTDKIIYDRFIQSIGSIYSSQDINGKILKFWTKLTETTDELGNTKYTYIPHPDSTLEYLDSKLSYYFIVRDTSFLPLSIPVLGGTVTNFADPDILPRVSIDSVDLNTGTGNSSFLNINADNLQINETYSYKFNTINSNWPANITPISGTLRSTSTSGSIQSILTLSPTTQNCNVSNIEYNIPVSCLVSNLNDKHIILQLELTPQSYDGDSVLSNEFTIKCIDCLPQAIISSSITNEDDRVKNQKETLSVNLTNFSKNKTYRYSIESLSATWPYYVSHPTGLIKITSATDSIKIDGVFCPSTEQYPSNTNNVLTYVSQNNNVTKQSWYRPSITLRASLTDQDYPTIIHYSNVLKLTCKNYSAPSSINSSVDIKNIQDS